MFAKEGWWISDPRAKIELRINWTPWFEWVVDMTLIKYSVWTDGVIQRTEDIEIGFFRERDEAQHYMNYWIASENAEFEMGFCRRGRPLRLDANIRIWRMPVSP